VRDLLSFIIKRFIMLIPILVGVSLITFLLTNIIPGDPAQMLAGEKATKEEVEALRKKLGLNDPIYIQYGRYLNKLLHLDLGYSLFKHKPVIEEITQRFMATLELTTFAMLFAFTVGVVLGVISATKRNSAFDHIARIWATLGISTPIFWLGVMLQLIFSLYLGWFPFSARMGVFTKLNKFTGLLILDSLIARNIPALLDVIKHLTLPVITLGMVQTTLISRITRSSMLEVLSQDYIRTARSKGLAERIVVFKHALKNALIPVVTVGGLNFAKLLGGAVLTETVYAWPGLGQYLWFSITYRDFPAVQGCVLTYAVIFVFINLVIDILYMYIDPRIKY